MATISAPRLRHFALILALLACHVSAHASEDCITEKTQPGVRRLIEKLASEALGESAVDRSTFSFCGFVRDEYASIAGLWQPQTDGSRIRNLVACQREIATPKKPWTCSKESLREMEVVGRTGTPLVAGVGFEIPSDLAASVIRRALEAAPAIQSTRQCDDSPPSAQRAEEVKRAFADPGPEKIFVRKLSDRMEVSRSSQTIVFKSDPQNQDRFELYCWNSYDEL